MTDSDKKLYREALAKAREYFDASKAALYENVKENTRLTEDIGNLRKTITALSALCSEEPGIDKLGITESVLQALAVTHYSWTTAEVVVALDSMGFDLSSQKNVQASVGAVLARLAQQGRITRATNPKRTEAGLLEWRGPKYDAKQDLIAGYRELEPGEEIPEITEDDIPF